VVGVVRDMRSGGIERQPVSQVYEVQSQRGDQVGSIVIRTTSDPAQLAASVRTLIHAADPTATISSVTTMQQLLDQQEGRRRFQTWLIGVFSAIALALAALGVFAVMHYSVAARIHEIGIRMAIGAGSGEIVRLVVGSGAKLALAGIAAGTLGALWGTEAIAGMLFQVRPTDPASFVFAAGVLAAVAIAACYLPARRATRIDPMVALRRE
jgi:putative ABC transport system permease protein